MSSLGPFRLSEKPSLETPLARARPELLAYSSHLCAGEMNQWTCHCHFLCFTHQRTWKGRVKIILQTWCLNIPSCWSIISPTFFKSFCPKYPCTSLGVIAHVTWSSQGPTGPRQKQRIFPDFMFLNMGAQRNFLDDGNLSGLSNMIASSHIWLLSVWHVGSVMEELNFLNCILINLNTI